VQRAREDRADARRGRRNRPSSWTRAKDARATPAPRSKAFMAYTTSKKVGVETFWGTFGQNVFWKSAGFKFKKGRDMGFGHRPSFQSTWRWFAELEADAIVDMIERAG